MRKVFEQTDSIENKELIYVYGNTYNEVFIGNVDSEHLIGIVFTPDEALLFAKEVIKVAKQIKSTIK